MAVHEKGTSLAGERRSILPELSVPQQAAGQTEFGMRPSRRDDLIQRVTAGLDGASSIEETLRLLTALFVPELATWCVADVISSAGTQPVAGQHAAGLGAAATDLSPLPLPAVERPCLLGWSVATQRAVLVDDLDFLDLETPWEARLRERGQTWGSGPALLVPIADGRRTAGIMAMCRVDGHPYGSAELALAGHLARLAGASLASSARSSRPDHVSAAVADELRQRSLRRAANQAEAEDDERPVIAPDVQRDASSGLSRDGEDPHGAGPAAHQRTDVRAGDAARKLRIVSDLQYRWSAGPSDAASRTTGQPDGHDGHSERDGVTLLPVARTGTVDVAGLQVPLVGLGTWQLRGEQAFTAVRLGLRAGHRHIDTATAYSNESDIGRGLADSGVSRDQVLFTSKLPPFDAGRERRTLEESLTALGIDQIDMWLLHWPLNGHAQAGAWSRMIALRDEGLVRVIGVSNYSLAQIDRLTQESGERPALNQLRWGPSVHQADILAGHRSRGIALTGFSPLNSTRLRGRVLERIARRHRTDLARVVLRWHVQHGIPTLVRSSDPERIRKNLSVSGFALTPDEMLELDGLTGGSGPANATPARPG